MTVALPLVARPARGAGAASTVASVACTLPDAHPRARWATSSWAWR